MMDKATSDQIAHVIMATKGTPEQESELKKYITVVPDKKDVTQTMNQHNIEKVFIEDWGNGDLKFGLKDANGVTQGFYEFDRIEEVFKRLGVKQCDLINLRGKME